MIKTLKVIAMLLALSAAAFATAVTGTVTDSDSQTWNNGAYTITYTNTIPGAPSVNGAAITTSFSGNLSSSGALAVTLPANATIFPAGSKWSFNVCPALTNPTCYSTALTIVGASQNISSQLSAIAVAPRVSGSALTVAYNDTEVSHSPPAMYLNLTDTFVHYWNGTAWTILSTSSSSGCAENTCVVNAPTADQTITGAHALTLSDAGSSLILHGYLLGGPDGATSDADSGKHIVDGAFAGTPLSVAPTEQWTVNSIRTTFAPTGDMNAAGPLASSYDVVNHWVDTESDTSAFNYANGIGGFVSKNSYNGTGTVSEISGIETWSQNEDTGSITTQYGLHSWVENDGAGSVTNMVGIYTYAGNFGGTVTRAIGLMVDNAADSGTVINNYGIDIEGQQTATVVNDVGLSIDSVGAGTSSNIGIHLGNWNFGNDGGSAIIVDGGLVNLGPQLTTVGQLIDSGLTVSLPICSDGSKQLSSTCAGLIPGADLVSHSITATQLAAQYAILRCYPGLGDGLNAIAAGTYLQTNCYNNSGVTWTITRIGCFTDNAGTSSLAATNGAGTALLTGAVTCTAAAGGAAGTQSATTTIASGDVIKFTFIADGTSKQSGWFVSLTQ